MWPHYFSLMSCHTWQKYDTRNKNKRFVLRGWSAHSLGAQEDDLLRGLHSSCTMGGKIKFKEVVVSQTGIKWWDIHKTSSFTRFISEFSWWNGTATHFVLPAVERQKVKQRNKEGRTRKRLFWRRKMYFQSLSWSQIKIPQVFWNMTPHEPSFVLLYSVCSYATLKSKS